MKIAIFLIALIGLSISQATPWVSPTTTLAKSYQSAAQTQAQAVAKELAAAKKTLDDAQKALTAALVPEATWKAFTDATKLVGTNQKALVAQDTALAGLVKTLTTAKTKCAGLTVDNQCQQLTASTRVKWQDLTKLYTTANGNAYTTALAAFQVKTVTDFKTNADKVKNTVTALVAAVDNGATATAGADDKKDPSGDLPLNEKFWQPTGTLGATKSYQKIGCPYSASGICKDCSTAAEGAVSTFTKDYLIKQTDCTWEKMNGWAQTLVTDYANVKSINTAKGMLSAYKALVDTNLKGANQVNAAMTAYQGQVTGVVNSVTGLQAAVATLEGVWLKLQAANVVAQNAANAQQASTAKVLVAAKAVSDAAGLKVTDATNALGALKTKDDAAAKAVDDQWKLLNTTVGDAMKAQDAVQAAVGVLGTANAQLAGALKAQGVAHELYTSSQASDNWATTSQSNYKTLAALSKTDYDAFAAYKKSSGSSMIQQTFVSLFGFIILLAYKKF